MNKIIFEYFKIFSYYFSHMFLVYTIYMLIFNTVQGSLKIIKITTRIPKPKDIGIIIDVTLQNFDEEYQELVAFRIRANGFCCVNVTPDVVMKKMGRIVGGNFGFIQPGAIQQISLIWPTVSLYNRVGLCPIAITSTNINNDESVFKKIITFDTRLQILDAYNTTLAKHFVDCRNCDTNYFKNYTTTGSEERYFGLPNIYNTTAEKCQEIPRCWGKYQNKPSNPPYDEFAEDIFKRSPHLHPLGQALEGKRYQESSNENERSALLFGLGEGLLVVFATITIYVLICFSIFLFVTWLSRRTRRGLDENSRGMILTPDHLDLSEENMQLYTTCSLMSHR